MPTLTLLTLSNIFMTTAWYWHLKGGPEVANARPLGLVILVSWLLAGLMSAVLVATFPALDRVWRTLIEPDLRRT